MNRFAKPKTIEAAIARTQKEIFKIDEAWGGKGPNQLAALGLELNETEEKVNAIKRLGKLNSALDKARAFEKFNLS
jgi:hypothetical protein